MSKDTRVTNSESKNMDRRKFLKNSMLGTVGAGLTFWGGSDLWAANKSPLITRPLGPGEQYKVGILGCGNRSKSHISALNDVPEIAIAALCDLVPHKMKRRAELIDQGPAPAMYTDMEEMFGQQELDAVAIVLPNYLHTEPTIAALEAGKHVLLEKPMALTVPECNDIMAAAERSRRALQIGTQRRHSDNFNILVETIRESPLGQLLQSDVSSYRGDWRVPGNDEYPPGVDYWRLDQQKCGGVVYEMGAHIIDVNNWVFDSEPVAVTSMQSVNNHTLRSRDSTDHAGVLVRYANGALMNYGGNLYNYGPNTPDYFFGENGSVEFTGGEVSIRYGQPKGVPTRGEVPEPQNKSLPDRNGTLGQWKHFTRVLAGEAKPYPDGYMGRQTIQICQGAVLAAREGRTVEVDELDTIAEL
ncbi:Predicted dehydrogenase [Fodinibius roseus]|uniref:Predicted dehydrogenase n=1 Tax=Fodinibius roseus TaxID=1194090 RepID=A0A1M5KRY4_9BACT|nr:Gfo/Idh/MocA family oxidoreductase [Fodinibius roseus]SHG55554.1 Predicted dehydrogenase [Fodinibius roseus]